MDSQDIKKTAPELGQQGSFPVMWGLQLNLIEAYQKIEGLPNYPLNLDTKDSQELMKDFIARVVEELAESYEAMGNGDYHNAKEELADALHFLLEALVFTGEQTLLDSPLRVPPGSSLIAVCLRSTAGLETPSTIEEWFWQTTYHLNIARNNLRNKKWKQTQVLAQKREFLRNMARAFHIFIWGFNLIDMGEKEIFEEYFKKNQVNWFRIKSKY